MISFEEFKKVNLKVARILEVYDIPNKDRLYRIIIDLGNEKRQIVSGIKQYYSSKELIGKSVVVVTNLEPKKIAGFESQGMLLAAFNGKQLALITPDKEIDPGTEVT